MSAPRVFLPPDAISGQHVSVSNEPWHHLVVVLRRKPGDRFIAVDASTGLQHVVQIAEVGERTLSGQLLETTALQPPVGLTLTLYQGLPKGKRFPLILQKCTELGVSRIVPVMTERTVVRLDEDAESKRRRWSKIVQEAARQCMLGAPPEVAAPLDFAGALTEWQASGCRGLFFDEALSAGAQTTLSEVLAEHKTASAMAAFVGPEGGFTQQEAEAAYAAGLASVGLGERILRTETAAIVACAIIMYEAGELG